MSNPQKPLNLCFYRVNPKGAARTRTGREKILEITARNACGGISVGAKTVAIPEIPADLRQVIAHWKSLPSEVKQTILTLVKHSRRRKKEKVS